MQYCTVTIPKQFQSQMFSKITPIFMRFGFFLENFQQKMKNVS